MTPAEVDQLLGQRTIVRIAKAPRDRVDAYVRRTVLNGIRITSTMAFWIDIAARGPDLARVRRLAVCLPDRRLFAYADRASLDWGKWHDATDEDLVELRLRLSV